MDVFAEIYSEIVTIKKQMARMIRPGTAGNEENGVFEIDVSDGEGDPIRARQKGLAVGGFKFHIGVSEGEPVTLFCPNGDPRDAFFFPGDWTGKTPNPSGKRNELVIEGNGARITMSDEKIVIEATDVQIKGNVEIIGNLAVNDGTVTNDGTNISRTHTHGGVKRGAAWTDPPG